MVADCRNLFTPRSSLEVFRLEGQHYLLRSAQELPADPDGLAGSLNPSYCVGAVGVGVGAVGVGVGAVEVGVIAVPA